MAGLEVHTLNVGEALLGVLQYSIMLGVQQACCWHCRSGQ